MNQIKCAVAMLLTIVVSGCTVVQPNADEVGVLIDRPIFFGEGGVREKDVREGGTRTYTWFSTEARYTTVKPTAEEVKFIDFNTKDNAPLDFATVFRYRVTNAPALIKLGDGWFVNSIKPQYTDIVRREVKGYNLQDLMSDQATADKLDDDVTALIKKVVAEQNLPIEVLSINLGRALPDPTVTAQMNQTVAERQRKLTMDQADAAEQARKNSETSRAAADNAYRLALGMTSEEFVSLEQAKLVVEACKSAQQCVLVPSGTNVVR